MAHEPHSRKKWQGTRGNAVCLLLRSPLPPPAGCLVASVTAFALLLLDRTRSARWLEALFGGVIAVEAAALATNYFMADIPDGELVRGLLYAAARGCCWWPGGQVPGGGEPRATGEVWEGVRHGRMRGREAVLCRWSGLAMLGG